MPGPRPVALLAAFALALVGIVVAVAPAEAAVTIGGQVTHSGPVNGAKVDLFTDPERNHAVGTTFTTGSDGRYSFTVPAGDYWVRAVGPAGINAVMLPVHVPTTGPVQDVDLPMVTYFSCSTQVLGTPNVGWQLTVARTPTPDEPFQALNSFWFRLNLHGEGNVDVPGVGDTYVQTDADLGHDLAQHIDMWNPADGRIGFCNATSADVGPRISALLRSPQLTGTHKVGKRLTAVPVLEAGAVPAYQWFRATTKGHGRHRHTVIKPIAGATGQVYEVKRKDKGSKVYVQVTGYGGPYAAATANSPPVKIKH